MYVHQLLHPGRSDRLLSEKIADSILAPSRKLWLSYKFNQQARRVECVSNLTQQVGELMKKAFQRPFFIGALLLGGALAVMYMSLVIFNLPFLISGLILKSRAIKQSPYALQFHMNIRKLIQIKILRLKIECLEKERFNAFPSCGIDKQINLLKFKIKEIGERV